jgi:coproporphyrinogen III oxidase
MTLTTPSSPTARLAGALVSSLQARLAAALEALPGAAPLQPVSWLRDGGLHGGGMRLEHPAAGPFNRATVNVSAVHYDDQPKRSLASATALSAIVHPDHPRAPSMHLHVSWTELRDGSGTWRIMADLNPSLPRPTDTAAFAAALQAAAPGLWATAARQGDRYFFLPALKRCRGVCHFYLEGYATADGEADRALAARVAGAAIDTYAALVAGALRRHGPPTGAEREAQLAYHTLYLLQVLTLDRGTTSGLLVHDQNDLGVMGSLPARVDRALLADWVQLQPAPQGALLAQIVEALPADGAVDAGTRLRLAALVRAHYRAHPEAVALQAETPMGRA